MSYCLQPSPEPSIFFFEPEPTSPLSSQQTLSTDNSASTLYVPFSSYDDCHDPKSNLTMPASHPAHGSRRAPCVLPPPLQRILTASGRPNYVISCLSDPGIRSDGDDSSASEMRLHIQLDRAALLLATVRSNTL